LNTTHTHLQPTNNPKLKWRPELEDTYKERITTELSNQAPTGVELPIVIKRVAKTLKLETRGLPPGYKPWFDQECRENQKMTQNALRDARKNAWQTPYGQRYSSARRTYKQLLNNKKKAYWDTQLQTLREANTTQKFWKEMRKYRKQPFVPNTIEEHTWKNFYNTQMQPRETRRHYEVYDQPHPLDEPISEKELRNALQHSANQKAPGLDGIPNEFWKYLPMEGTSILLEDFNKIFDTEELPTEWSVSETESLPFASHSMTWAYIFMCMYNRLAYSTAFPVQKSLNTIDSLS